MKYYYKCKDLDNEFREHNVDLKSLSKHRGIKEQVAEEIAEMLYHCMGLNKTTSDGDYIVLSLYDENKEILANACVLMEIPEPTFTVQL